MCGEHIHKVKHRDAARTTCTQAHRDAHPHNLLKSRRRCLSDKSPLIFPANLLLLLRSGVALPSHSSGLSVERPLALAAHLLLLLGREVVLHHHPTSCLHPRASRQALTVTSSAWQDHSTPLPTSATQLQACASCSTGCGRNHQAGVGFA